MTQPMPLSRARNRTILFLTIIAILTSCSGLERTEREKLKKQNCKAEYIYREDNDYQSPLALPAHTPRTLYPWESEAHLPRITKEFFRCKGSPLNPPLPAATPLSDCDAAHGLPILHGKEGVYPILVDLLNYVQKKTGKRVVITCGHRCPSHNTYAAPDAKTSKHQIGAEVDFYVQGMEDRPQEIAGLLMQYYQEVPLYRNQKEYQTFQRYEKADANVSIQPWLNKEVYIKINQRHEGRDLDNHHPHPYLTIQVRYDRSHNEKVAYDWAKATNYPRG